MSEVPGIPGGVVAEERARNLVRLFCDGDSAFGSVALAAPGEVPAEERVLLDHLGHMTVAMERLHGSPVALRVVAERPPEAGQQRYAREIVLLRGDGRVVQYGIVRIDLGAVPPAIASAILRRTIPLGRILIDAELMCEVQDVNLVRVTPGPHLARLVGNHRALHGRVAAIHVGGLSAVELLEVVVPA